MIYCVDDVCPSFLLGWSYWDDLHRREPDSKIIAFCVACRDNKENVQDSKEFKEWFEARKGWVECGVHGYDHTWPQEGWRPDQAAYISRALDTLRPFLPPRLLYRPPGFRTTPQTEKICRKLGFAGIAYQTHIKDFQTKELVGPIINAHCYDHITKPKGPSTKIDLGCGNAKPEGYIGVDCSENSQADVVHDCTQPLPFEDNLADEIRCANFLEHIPADKVIELVNEIYRVLKPAGRWHALVPNAAIGQAAFQDPTHRSFWTENTFKYFENNYYKQLYGITAKFKIIKLQTLERSIDYWGKLSFIEAVLEKI